MAVCNAAPETARCAVFKNLLIFILHELILEEDVASNCPKDKKSIIFAHYVIFIQKLINQLDYYPFDVIDDATGALLLQVEDVSF